MRTVAVAILALAALWASPSEARLWSHPRGTFTVELPRRAEVFSFPGQLQPCAYESEAGNCMVPSTITIYSAPFASDPHSTCVLTSTYAPRTESMNGAALRELTRSPFNSRNWLEVMEQLRRRGETELPDHPPDAAIRTYVDTSDAWPIQRAVISGPDLVINVAAQQRPGSNIAAACWTHQTTNSDAAAFADTVLGSMRHPRDAEWR